jgi:hypothetical protein
LFSEPGTSGAERWSWIMKRDVAKLIGRFWPRRMKGSVVFVVRLYWRAIW